MKEVLSLAPHLMIYRGGHGGSPRPTICIRHFLTGDSFLCQWASIPGDPNSLSLESCGRLPKHGLCSLNTSMPTSKKMERGLE